MTVLAANWENMGGGVLRKAAEGGVVGSQGDTIVHPLKANIDGGIARLGVYAVTRWTGKTVEDFPTNVAPQLGTGQGNTLAEAFAASDAI